MGTLNATVLGGRDVSALRPAASSLALDSYVTVTVGFWKRSTPPCLAPAPPASPLHPRWGHELSFPVGFDEELMRLELWGTRGGAEHGVGTSDLSCELLAVGTLELRDVLQQLSGNSEDDAGAADQGAAPRRHRCCTRALTRLGCM
jgi:hypothetical protein